MHINSESKRSYISQQMIEIADICDNTLFWEIGVDLRVKYVNQTLSEHIGLSHEKLLGEKIKSFLHPADYDFFVQTIRKNSIFEKLKHRIVTKDRRFSHLITCGKTLIVDGEVKGYFGISTIETKNIIANKVIKKLQATSKTILNCLSEAVIIVGRNGKTFIISPKFNNIWGFDHGETHILTMDEIIKRMHNQLNHIHNKTDLSFIQDMDSKKTTKDVLKFKDGRYIERKSSPHKYQAKIVGKCWSFKDITQRTNLVEKLGKLAFRDSLTKLYNRRWCEKKLKQLLKISNNQNLSFFYMDLDHFKIINDSCGHIHGDEVLEEISALLLKTVGENSFLARLGGDEFGLILVDKNKQQVMQISQDIQKAIAQYTFLWKKKIFKIGISIGIVFIGSDDDFRSIFIHADEACYFSKETGRNKCVVYNAKDIKFQKTKTELKWYDAIQKALLNDKFELWAQAINDDENPRKHYEILLRMRGDKNELISPSLFLGAADRFGMIYMIDKRVIKSFFDFYLEHLEKFGDTIFSINISGHSLSREDFLSYVIGFLKYTKIDCSNICFEITENELIQNLERALLFINEVRSLGCKISLDDFGKGLTSFSYLKNIPYDFIKIDGQFIKEVDDDKINAAIIKSIVYIAEVMDKKTIAEHIESQDIYNKISKLGVNYFQGNYFSQPKKLDVLIE